MQSTSSGTGYNSDDDELTDSQLVTAVHQIEGTNCYYFIFKLDKNIHFTAFNSLNSETT